MVVALIAVFLTAGGSPSIVLAQAIEGAPATTGWSPPVPLRRIFPDGPRVLRNVVFLADATGAAMAGVARQYTVPSGTEEPTALLWVLRWGSRSATPLRTQGLPTGLAALSVSATRSHLVWAEKEDRAAPRTRERLLDAIARWDTIPASSLWSLDLSPTAAPPQRRWHGQRLEWDEELVGAVQPRPSAFGVLAAWGISGEARAEVVLVEGTAPAVRVVRTSGMVPIFARLLRLEGERNRYRMVWPAVDRRLGDGGRVASADVAALDSGIALVPQRLSPWAALQPGKGFELIPLDDQRLLLVGRGAARADSSSIVASLSVDRGETWAPPAVVTIPGVIGALSAWFDGAGGVWVAVDDVSAMPRALRPIRTVHWADGRFGAVEIARTRHGAVSPTGACIPGIGQVLLVVAAVPGRRLDGFPQLETQVMTRRRVPRGFATAPGARRYPPHATCGRPSG